MAYISLKNVSVEYKIYNSKNRSFRQKILNSVGGLVNAGLDGTTVISAIKNINLELRSGDRIALIGHNGSGKSTMLKMLSGIYEPVSGVAEISGRVTSLFDMTMGMDFELTGKDNIILKGILLGHSLREIKKIIEDVVEFSELEDYINLPMRVYSSGMVLRLAFGIITSFKPEIILLDEIIGVGDEKFAERAKSRMNKMLSTASILVIASHSKELILEYCNKGILMKNGEIIQKGPITEVLENYIN
jgi:ABC-2 type transport system ATP-binding protein/lipopolysaccharide transport system ATP-binding protein